MANRMAITVLALVGTLISAYMSAYRFGLLGTIVCGTGGCETVQNSPWATFIGVPVPLIGLFGYGGLFGVALASLQPRFQDDPRIARMLAVAAVVGLTFSAYLTWLEAAVIRAWCQWCIVSAMLATLIFVVTVPEFRRLRSPA